MSQPPVVNHPYLPSACLFPVPLRPVSRSTRLASTLSSSVLIHGSVLLFGYLVWLPANHFSFPAPRPVDPANLSHPLSGLINNVLYVIILSAALDLVGSSLPKAIVLLADVVPSFLTKLVAPHFVHLISYRMRILILVALSFIGMQLVAWADSLPERLFGVVLASVSSGLGELSFLSMTHFYGPFAVPFWSSGTGGAGLVGAGLYVFATTWIGFSVRGSLMAFGFLPAIMLVAFFGILPLGPLRGGNGYEPLRDGDEVVDPDLEDDGAAGRLLAPLGRSPSGHTFPAVSVSYTAGEKTFASQVDVAWRGFRANFRKIQHLFLP